MKIYKAYLSQGDGNGCDYTIDCGKKVINIEANSMDDAKQKLVEIIKEDYSYSEGRLSSAELYEIENVFQVDIEELYIKFDKYKYEIKQQEKEEKERQEFLRLQAKFGNK